jgi:hypothetical protein
MVDRLRRSDVLGAVLLFGLMAVVATFFDAAAGRRAAAAAVAAKAELVAGLGLTDLVLFTEARYTRHPSQADLHSAFQDHPNAFEHFPSGALLPPPGSVRRGK